jgi:hypothetical protein
VRARQSRERGAPGEGGRGPGPVHASGSRPHAGACRRAAPDPCGGPRPPAPATRPAPTCADKRALNHAELALQSRQPRADRHRRRAARPGRPAARRAELPPHVLHRGTRLAQQHAGVALQAAAQPGQVGAVVLTGTNGEGARRGSGRGRVRGPGKRATAASAGGAQGAAGPAAHVARRRARRPAAQRRRPTSVVRSSRCSAATSDTTGSTSGSTSA